MPKALIMPPRTMAKRSHSKPRIFPPTVAAIVAQEPSSAKDEAGTPVK